MNASAKRLEETGSALREAMAQLDWTAISVLDLQCCQVVEAARYEPLRDEIVVREQMQELLGLYRELLHRCQAERLRVSGELIQVSQTPNNSNVYKLFR